MNVTLACPTYRQEDGVVSWMDTGGHAQHHRIVTCALPRNHAIAIFASVAVPAEKAYANRFNVILQPESENAVSWCGPVSPPGLEKRPLSSWSRKQPYRCDAIDHSIVSSPHRTTAIALSPDHGTPLSAPRLRPAKSIDSRIARTSLPLIASLITQLNAPRTAAYLPLLLPSTITIAQDT